MAVVQLCLAFATHSALVVLCTITGFMYGSFFVLIPALSLDVFGSRGIAAIYAALNTGVLASLLALVLMMRAFGGQQERGSFWDPRLFRPETRSQGCIWLDLLLRR